jgi:hypothetical protein
MKDIGIKPDHNADASGFEKPSQEVFNKVHGRKPKAPTKGGGRQAVYDALLTKGKATD